MVAFFPNISSSPSEWQLEDDINELFAYYSPNLQDASNNSITSSPQPPEFDSGQDLNCPTTRSNDHPISMKRSIHNEYERDRRKKLNSLYASLRNLLPDADQNIKKLSIPCTIARVLKYIPELHRNIERLTRRKEETLLRISKEQRSSSFNNGHRVGVDPVISAACLNRREVMVQICIKNTNEMIPLSKIVKMLEGEGLELMNASTLATHADETFYSLHLQGKDVIMMEEQSYCMHLINVLKKQARVSSISYYT